MYNKLFGQIVTSSVWLAPDAHRIVWLTLLATMDQDCIARYASVANVAHTARVSLEDARAALATFEAPDPDSSDPDHEGRRIERIPGGWLILNGPKYRDLATREHQRIQTRERVRKYRERNAPVTHSNEKQAKCNGSVTPSDSYSEADAKDKQKTKNTTAASRPAQCPEFEIFKSLYPRRAGSQPWPRALKSARARIQEGASWHDLHDGARRYAEFCRITGKIGTEFVQQAATFLGPAKPFMEPWSAPATKADVRLAGNMDAAAEFMRRTDNAAH